MVSLVITKEDIWTEKTGQGIICSQLKNNPIFQIKLNV
jgi:hypothetical protein